MSRPIQTKMQVLKHHRIHKIEAQPSQGLRKPAPTVQRTGSMPLMWR